MNSILVLKWVGGGLLLGSSSVVCVVASVDPQSVGTTVHENIKPEEEINFYASLTKPAAGDAHPKITKSSTNFQCKWKVGKNNDKNTEPFYCEIYKWNNATNKKENHYEAKDLAEHFTLPHDVSAENIDWIRVKFNKKYFDSDVHAGDDLMLQIIPYYQDPNVVVDSKIIFKFVDEEAKDASITQFLIKGGLTTPITGVFTTYKCKLGEKAEENCKIYEFNKSESVFSSDNDYSSVVFEKVELQPIIVPATPPEHWITQHKHYIVDFHEQTSGTKTEADYKNKQISYSVPVNPPPNQSNNMTMLKPVIMSKIAGKDRLIIL